MGCHQTPKRERLKVHSSPLVGFWCMNDNLFNDLTSSKRICVGCKQLRNESMKRNPPIRMKIENDGVRFEKWRI